MLCVGCMGKGGLPGSKFIISTRRGVYPVPLHHVVVTSSPVGRLTLCGVGGVRTAAVTIGVPWAACVYFFVVSCCLILQRCGRLSMRGAI